MIELDGSLGEGGGQILRSSLALSLLTGQPFHLRNIRAGRAKPGLQPQHLMSVMAAAKIGDASLCGASLGSSDLTFDPGEIKPGTYRFPIRTAGATALVLHTIYLPLALASQPSEVTIEGGTHVSHAPCFDFLERGWQPLLRQMKIHVRVEMDRPGFYPRGGGCVRAFIQPSPAVHPFHGLTINRAGSATIRSAVAGLPDHVAARMAKHAKRKMESLGLRVSVNEHIWSGGPGCMLAIELDTQPTPTFFFALGEKGKPAEQVADEAVTQARDFLRVDPPGIDEHSADQLLLPLAFARGKSEFRVARVSSHLLTNAEVVRRFLPRELTIEGDEGGPGTVRVG
jgi:RNA 3'-phosphate cyclase